MRKHLVIPDSQVKDGVPLNHLHWIGEYIIEKKPDVIVHLGDFADMPSLSYYDRGKKKAEGLRYESDIFAARRGLNALFGRMKLYNNTRKKNKKKLYKPEMHMCLGNHEERINRYVEDNAYLEGKCSIDDLGYQEYGWQVHPFKEIVVIDGVHYSHYFYYPKTGKPIGGSIENRMNKLPFSFVQGHEQDYLMGVRTLNNGKRIRALVQGACYLHEEEYRGPQANTEWKGVFLLHEVKDGDYNLCEVSLDYLCQRYEGIPLKEFLNGRRII